MVDEVLAECGVDEGVVLEGGDRQSGRRVDSESVPLAALGPSLQQWLCLGWRRTLGQPAQVGNSKWAEINAFEAAT